MTHRGAEGEGSDARDLAAWSLPPSGVSFHVDIRKPHDALFRFAFEDEREARALLRQMLRSDPASRAIAEHVDWSRLKRMQDGFADAADRPFATDLWFSAPLGDGYVLLHVILEHKSSPDALSAWQVTRYTVRSIDRLHQEAGRPQRLPLVLPIVVYHGDEPWTAARDVRDLFAIPSDLSPEAQAALRSRMPSCTYDLQDLGAIAAAMGDDARASLVARLAIHFLCHMRNLTAEQLPGALLQVRDLLVAVQGLPRGRLLLGMLFSYLRATAKADVAAVHAAVRGSLPPTTSDAMLNPLERAFEEATNRGLAEGLAKGLGDGQRAMLRRLLQKRFGPLPQSFIHVIEVASKADLDAWCDRILDAATLDEVIRG